MENIKSRVTYIYALMDGIKVRYIGKSEDPYKRLIYHIKYGKKIKNYKQNWVKKTV